MESENVAPRPKRLLEIDRGKGIGIFLVVVGHIVTAGLMPARNDWYWTLKWAIYDFHMQFFMFLSGLALWIATIRKNPNAWSKDVDLRAWPAWMWAKVGRMFPAYLLFGSVTIVAKLLLAPFMHVDNQANDVLWSWFLVLAAPAYSPAGSLWYVMVLLELYAVFTLLHVLVQGRTWMVVAIGGIGYALNAIFQVYGVYGPIPWLSVDLVLEYLPFFALGAMASRGWEGIGEIIDKVWLVTGVLLVLACIGRTHGYFFEGGVALLAIPTLMGLARRWESPATLALGQYSFAIYLMNMFAIGGAKGVILKVMSWDGPAFYAIAPVLVASGLLIPIAIKKWVLPWFPWLDRITS